MKTHRKEEREAAWLRTSLETSTGRILEKDGKGWGRFVVSCPCRDDGPWVVYGPLSERYACVRCGRRMRSQAMAGLPSKARP